MSHSQDQLSQKLFRLNPEPQQEYFGFKGFQTHFEPILQENGFKASKFISPRSMINHHSDQHPSINQPYRVKTYEDEHAIYYQPNAPPIFETKHMTHHQQQLEIQQQQKYNPFFNQKIFSTQKEAHQLQLGGPINYRDANPMFYVSREQPHSSQTDLLKGPTFRLCDDEDDDQNPFHDREHPYFRIDRPFQDHLRRFPQEAGLGPGNIKIQEKQRRKKGQEKRGTLTEYIAANTEEFLVQNTLTGFLISLLSARGPLNFEEIEALVEPHYQQLRKPSGRKYNPTQISKSIMASLSANGLFHQISKPVPPPANTRLSRKISSLLEEKVWMVKENEARDYVELEREKFSKTKAKLNLRTRKFKTLNVTQHQEQEYYENYEEGMLQDQPYQLQVFTPSFHQHPSTPNLDQLSLVELQQIRRQMIQSLDSFSVSKLGFIVLEQIRSSQFSYVNHGEQPPRPYQHAA